MSIILEASGNIPHCRRKGSGDDLGNGLGIGPISSPVLRALGQSPAGVPQASSFEALSIHPNPLATWPSGPKPRNNKYSTSPRPET